MPQTEAGCQTKQVGPREVPAVPRPAPGPIRQITLADPDLKLQRHYIRNLAIVADWLVAQDESRETAAGVIALVEKMFAHADRRDDAALRGFCRLGGARLGRLLGRNKKTAEEWRAVADGHGVIVLKDAAPGKVRPGRPNWEVIGPIIDAAVPQVPLWDTAATDRGSVSEEPHQPGVLDPRLTGPIDENLAGGKGGAPALAGATPFPTPEAKTETRTGFETGLNHDQLGEILEPLVDRLADRIGERLAAVLRENLDSGGGKKRKSSAAEVHSTPSVKTGDDETTALARKIIQHLGGLCPAEREQFAAICCRRLGPNVTPGDVETFLNRGLPKTTSIAAKLIREWNTPATKADRLDALSKRDQTQPPETPASGREWFCRKYLVWVCRARRGTFENAKRQQFIAFLGNDAAVRECARLGDAFPGTDQLYLQYRRFLTLRSERNKSVTEA